MSRVHDATARFIHKVGFGDPLVTTDSDEGGRDQLHMCNREGTMGHSKMGTLVQAQTLDGVRCRLVCHFFTVTTRTRLDSLPSPERFQWHEKPDTRLSVNFKAVRCAQRIVLTL